MKRGQYTGKPAFGSSTGFGGFGGLGSSSSLSYLSEPPAFHTISDPNIVVSLKNILKKDSTTKTKALDDVLSYVAAHPFEKDGGVEDAILDVWDNLYPRASIDNARRVRELAHTLQLALMKSARKRMERHIPNTVGAWLAGQYDRDRAVARAASDGLTSFLTTPEKEAAFWKKCQSQILSFASDAIQETTDSLSDERSTTKEDAEAKYYRVVNASLSLVLNLLLRMNDEEVAKAQEDYDYYFSFSNVWKSISLGDATVRRTTSQMLMLCLKRKLSYIDSPECHAAIIGGLKTSQTGSAVEYLDALRQLTKSDPAIWESSTNSKKSSVARLNSFIAKGSQGSRAGYWEALDQLLSIIPDAAFRSNPDADILDGIQKGLQNREEPRANNKAAWQCYANMASRTLSQLSTQKASELASKHMLPLFGAYLFPVADKSVSGAGPCSAVGLKHIYISLKPLETDGDSAAKQEWERLGGMMCAKLAASLPSVSKEYQSSQELVGEEGKRWFELNREIHSATTTSPGVPDHISDQSSKIIAQCISLLESRKMKPFGAAKIIDYAMKLCPHLFQGSLATRIVQFLDLAAVEQMENVVQTPSAAILQKCVASVGSIEGTKASFEKLWNTWIDAALELPEGNEKSMMLGSLVTHDHVQKLVKENESLQAELVAQGRSLARGQSKFWVFFTSAIGQSGLSKPSEDALVKDVTTLMEEHANEPALNVLELLVRSMPEALAEKEDLHTTLVTKLLALSEIHDRPDVSAKASSIRAMLENHNDGQLPVVGIVQSNLEQANPQSLSIETLVKQARSAATSGTALEDLLPNTNVWMDELASIASRQLNPSLSITNVLQGAALLGQANSQKDGSIPRTQRDRKGRSVPVRMALYTSALCESHDEDVLKLPTALLVEILYAKSIIIQLATDQLTSLDKNGLWQNLAGLDTSREAEDLVSTLRTQLRQYAVRSEWWNENSASPLASAMRDLADLLVRESGSLTSWAAYSARALCELLQYVVDCPGLTSFAEETYLQPANLKIAPEAVLVSAAVMAGLGEVLQTSKPINTLCNRLVSELVDADVNGRKTPLILALCSLLPQVYEQGELPVANNRIVFAVRRITSWLDEPEEIEGHTAVEVCRTLSALLPCMKDVYGSYWEKTVEFCLHLWNGAQERDAEEVLPIIHASLKLSRVLETIPEPNDDLVDALKMLQAAKPKALLELLKLPREIHSQPAEIVDSLLCREADKIPDKNIDDLSDIFPLVASDSKEIQTAAFNLLHRAIPLKQQQMSVDVVLEKTDARLSDELLSLLLDAPVSENLSDEVLAQFPTAVRCYLLSWKLVFDAFSTSSFKVRDDFTENLKSEDCLGSLLEFMFEVLGHSAAHPLNLDKEGFTSEQIYDFDMKLARAESEERSMQWLLVHLYYLVLKYVPGLFRTWYIDCRSKQTRIAVEAWTTKHYSPLIVSDSLDEVQNWADNQEPPAMDEQELQIKVSKAAREVVAGYEVDEAQASISIKIPASYPIDNVVVASQHRVAVSEKKWQSWIMTTQGVITFSNGNIIDGLQVFKRNIVGALKGQSECAICYSIISTDKRMPDKRCTTCKNLFHRTCLYKWFQTSNQNTCPLCRNPIDYLGADTAKRRQ